MGKKLIFDYTFDPAAKTITLGDVYAQKRFLLITNVTTGDIIYQFNDNAAGMSDITFNYTDYDTTIRLTSNFAGRREYRHYGEPTVC